MKTHYLTLKLITFLTLSAALFPLFPESKEPGLSQYVMTIWTDREGLPSDTILDVVQDKTGYIWLASYDGLVRFDGEKFTVLTAADSGFTGKSARVLETAPDGTLWIGTNTAGLYKYDKGLFTRYGLEQGLPDLSVRSIAIDNAGKVWVGTANGVSRMNGNRFESAVPAGSPSFGIANFLLPLHDGTVIVGSNLNGLWLITDRGVEPYLANQGLSDWSFSSAFLERDGMLWLGSSSGEIFRVTRNEIRERFTPDFLKGSSINSFYMDSEGTLWIATDRGILSRRGNEFANFSETDGLPSNVVSSLYRDTEGNLWVGTERGGLAKFSRGKFVNTSKQDGLVSDAVNAVTEDSFRSVWVATDEGVSFYPSTSDTYKTDAERTRAVDGVLAKLKGTRVRQIRAEKDGSLWFATYSDSCLFVLNPDGTTKSINQKSGLPTNRVRFSFRTSKGNLWIGTTAGPVLFEGEKVTSFGTGSGLQNLFILCIMEDEAGNIWLGSDGGGVSLYDGKSFRTMTTKDGLAGNVVFRIFRDSSNRLWMCTSEGLSLYVNKAFLSADFSIGMSGQSVYEALEDKNARLWIITSNKVIVAPSDELSSAVGSGKLLESLRFYDRLDGLAGQLSANAWTYMNDSGIVYLPTLKGLSTYNPQAVSLNLLPPPVIMERFLVDGSPVEPSASSVKLSARSQRVTFYYTALSYVVPQRVRFQYKLDGFDRNWISSGTNREIGYTNLPPGNYTFRIKAENNDGIVNEEGAVISFYKKPFFYQTILFYVGMALVLVLFGFLIAYIRVRRLASRARNLDRLVKERTRELAEEKDKSDSLLLNILPPLIADELKETGHATPHVYENTAVLFADIVGFTPWAAEREPDDIICELNDIFTNFDAIMVKHGCERIKSIGDGYLACCGLPLPEKDYAAKMVRAGIDMLEYVERRNSESDGESVGTLEIRIGIDAGSIVGGVVGVKKYIFDVFGDTVNTAFRLEAISVPMGLTISEKVVRLVGDEFTLIERPGRVVKGKGVMPSYYVCYKKDAPKAMDNAQAISKYSRAQKLLDDGKYDECFDILDSFDYTTLESEVGFDLYQLSCRVWEHSGKTDKARLCKLRAERFRM